MAKRRRKNAGQINFFKAMAVLGILVTIWIAYGFIGSAPDISPQPFHKGNISFEECLDCHMKNVTTAPIMPHRVMKSCTSCHNPPENTEK
jgi:hypothetical protein